MKKRLFAIGDIHGCFEQLRALVETEICLSKEDQLVLLGDYIDRGAQSKEVIDYIMHLQDSGYQLTALMGNHEDMLLKAILDIRYLTHWLMNGGVETLNSFGLILPDDLDDSYLEFFKSLVYYHQIDRYLFVHAGFNDEAENPFADTHHMLWKTQEVYRHPQLLDKIVVHGHSAITAEACRENVKGNTQVIDVDTGCVYANQLGYGKLTAIELYSRRLFTV